MLHTAINFSAVRTQDHCARREAAFPSNPDPECVAISRALALGYGQARLLKVLSYGEAVDLPTLALLSGLSDVLSSLRKIRERTAIKSKAYHSKSGAIIALSLDEPNAEAIRRIIRQSWGMA